MVLLDINNTLTLVTIVAIVFFIFDHYFHNNIVKSLQKSVQSYVKRNEQDSPVVKIHPTFARMEGPMPANEVQYEVSAENIDSHEYTRSIADFQRLNPTVSTRIRADGSDWEEQGAQMFHLAKHRLPEELDAYVPEAFTSSFTTIN